MKYLILLWFRTFSIKLSKLIKKINAVDISSQFILVARKTLKKFGKNNAKFKVIFQITKISKIR